MFLLLTEIGAVGLKSLRQNVIIGIRTIFLGKVSCAAHYPDYIPKEDIPF